MQKELSDIIAKQQEIIKNQDTIIKNFEKIIEESNKRIACLEAENAYLKQELTNIKRMVFGRKSERYVAEDPAQLNLFDIPKETIEKEQEEMQVLDY